MADITHQRGGTTLTGKGIDLFAVASLRGALYLETKGLRVHRGPKGMALDKARDLSGINFPKGDKGRLAAIEWLDGYIILLKGGCSVETEEEVAPKE